MISLEKWSILTTLQKLPKNMGGLGKFLKSCPKSKKIAQTGHTAYKPLLPMEQDRFKAIDGAMELFSWRRWTTGSVVDVIKLFLEEI